MNYHQPTSLFTTHKDLQEESHGNDRIKYALIQNLSKAAFRASTSTKAIWETAGI